VGPKGQNDVLMGKSRNMMDSSHGWSAWLIPGLWCQYLLTGEEEWLRKTMNSMGTCAQLVDTQTGTLRWAFVSDPYRDVTMLMPNPDNPMRGKRVDRTIGEEYVPMIASFHYPGHEPVRGNGCRLADYPVPRVHPEGSCPPSTIPFDLGNI
jgi:hypothetical protein